MAINVNRSIPDVFYRYKMPRLIAKVEGKGNGIKTVIVNMSEIAKSLSRPPTYPTKYFGCELGAQTQFDAANDRYIVNGAHDATKLQDLLDGFIKKFVLCPECDNPETNLNVYQKKQQITQNCIACGHQANVDMRHKLTTFILKNPPEPDSGIGPSDVTSATTTTSKGKKNEKSGSKSKKSSARNKESNDNGNGDAAQHDNNTDAQDSKKNKSSRSSKNHEDYDDDEDWIEDTSDAAVQARKDGLSTAIKSMTVSEDSEKSEKDRINIFYSFVQQRKAAGQMTGGDKEKDIVLEADRLDIRDKAPLVLMELLFDANILQQIKQHKSLLQRFTNKNDKAQKYLLGGFEQLVGIVHPDVLLPKTPHILKMFYEEDILDEEAIIEWDKKPSKKYITKDVSKELHAKAEPLVTWLKEAEEESSDEEDDVEVVYTDSNATVDSNPASAVMTAPLSGTSTANNDDDDDDDDDDVNIDDI